MCSSRGLTFEHLTYDKMLRMAAQYSVYVACSSAGSKLGFESSEAHGFFSLSFCRRGFPLRMILTHTLLLDMNISGLTLSISAHADADADQGGLELLVLTLRLLIPLR